MSAALTLLLVLGGLLVLPGLFDADTFKGAALALPVAALLLPWLLLRRRELLLQLLSSRGLLLLLASLGWSLLLAWPALAHGQVADRLSVALLGLAAAALTAAAARDNSLALVRAVIAVTLLTALLALLQAVGIESVLNVGSGEVVAGLGNSTRAAALLALGLPVALAVLLAPPGSEAPGRVRLAAAALNFGLAALLLTRGRAGWLAAAAGLLAVMLLDLGAVRRQLRTWLIPVVVGCGLAVFLADGPSALFAPKLPSDAGLLSAGDTTFGVRRAVWQGTLAMVNERPLLGHGLGRFRESFPPYRDPLEAALPGRGGAATEVDHPHNELLLAAAEGGWPAALLLLSFLLLTLHRALQRARSDAASDSAACLGDRAAFGLLVASSITALAQNSWTSPGTALPFFAAVGWIWRPLPGVAASTKPSAARALLVPAVVAATLLLAVLAIPRLRGQLLLRDFLHAAEAEGVTVTTLQPLLRAAEIDAGNADAQRLLIAYGGEVLRLSPASAATLAVPVESARRRLELLAPHSR